MDSAITFTASPALPLTFRWPWSWTQYRPEIGYTKSCSGSLQEYAGRFWLTSRAAHQRAPPQREGKSLVWFGSGWWPFFIELRHGDPAPHVIAIPRMREKQSLQTELTLCLCKHEQQRFLLPLRGRIPGPRMSFLGMTELVHPQIFSRHHPPGIARADFLQQLFLRRIPDQLVGEH